MPIRAGYQKHSATSRAGAAEKNKTIGLACRAVLNVIARTGGATIAEIAHELRTDKSSISGRISDLRDKFTPALIQDSGEARARAGITKVPGTIWTATDAGRRVAGYTVAKRDNEVPQLSMEFSR